MFLLDILLKKQSIAFELKSSAGKQLKFVMTLRPSQHKLNKATKITNRTLFK